MDYNVYIYTWYQNGDLKSIVKENKMGKLVTD